MNRPFSLLSLTLLLACGDKDTGSEDDLIDSDSDGFTEADDCDDLDPTVYPGATEYCNDIDDNCDGQVDVEAVETEGV